MYEKAIQWNTNNVDGMISKPQRLNLDKWDGPEYQENGYLFCSLIKAIPL